jgi:nucleotide-binding universal stress UspA family protein/glycosyltransferase involved in cell wall biosynthesis
MSPWRRPFQKVLIPIIHGYNADSALTVGKLLVGQENLLLFGLVPIPADQSLSVGATHAQALRRTLRNYPDATHSRARVSHDPWNDLVDLVHEEKPDLLILEWPSAAEALGVSLDQIMEHPPCDLCIVRTPFKIPKRILVPIRGGPYAELALKMALVCAKSVDVKITSLHIKANGAPAVIHPTLAKKQDAAFAGLSRVLANLPEIEQNHFETEDPAATILKFSKQNDLIIMGATAHPLKSEDPFGETAERVLAESSSGVIIVKTSRAMPAETNSELIGQRAISVLVDKWFAENTFHANEFNRLEELIKLKEKQSLTISLAMPALNEEKTVGRVIRTIKSALLERVKLLDEIILVDSGSTDRTRQIAGDLGIPTFVHQDILPQYGGRVGKGDALWKSLYATRGDIVLWVDTDIVNINPRFVFGLIGPLLAHSHLQFIKGFYRRPLRVGNKIQAGGGGRVTELTARPMLNLFYPELSGVVQPLSGEYGGRRAALEQLTFYSGYGVETGLLIDVFEKYGLAGLGQVDLEERVHHNQDLEALSMMSFAIIQVMMRKLEKRYSHEFLADVNKTLKLIRYSDKRFFLDVEEIVEQERPPMISLPEYAARLEGPAYA